MGTIFTESEMLSAGKLDEVAKAKAAAFGDKIAKYSNLVIDAFRLLTK